tara:strand:- start:2632 stop:3210 length:579 start_codon:yes stop_codon:yes gene_type:complete
MLEITVKNKDEWTEDEWQQIHSWDIAMVSMASGVGRIANKNYPRFISVEEATLRFNEIGWNVSEEFVQKMADTGWSSNVANETTREFIARQAALKTRDLVERLQDIDDKIQYDVVKNAFFAEDKLIMLIEEYGNDKYLNRIEGARLPMAWTYNCIPDHFFALDYIYEGYYLDLQEAGKIMKLVFKKNWEIEE